jgi:hypothetical protein
LQRDSTDSVVTGYELDDFGSIPDRDEVFLFSLTSMPPAGPLCPTIQRVPGIKQSDLEANSSASSIAEIENTWSL